MGIQAGIVGLPNVGKSTLFNALTKSSIPAENYPFCTVDPHVAITYVPDNRLKKLQTIFQSKKIIPSDVTFVDIAGLVKGAAAGEGLGNAFLSNIRSVDLILHVVRCFEDPNVTNTQASIDPLEDYETIVAELILKDLESIDKRLLKIETLLRKTQTQPAQQKLLKQELEVVNKIKNELNDGNNENVRSLTDSLSEKTIDLLSAKNFFIVANVSEDDMENDTYRENSHVQTLLKKFGPEKVVVVCAKLEFELSKLSEAEAQDVMEMMNINSRGVDTIIKKTYFNLGLITYFTCGPQETRAWSISKGMNARQSAGAIHSDFERGFICAEVFSCNDIFDKGSVASLKELGKVRREGQDYITQDGDVILFRFNV